MLDPRSLRLMIVTSGTVEPFHGHRAIADAAIRGGATAVQLRAPELLDDALLPIAMEVAGWCRANGVLFIVNDRLDVARESGADGVHLGQSDDPAGARRHLTDDQVLGISVADPAQAGLAAAQGADYLGVTVWPTPTKHEAVGVGTDGIAAIRRASRLPIVGIGGIGRIGRTDLDAVFAAGAAGVAVISAVAAASDPFAATLALRQRIDRLGVADGPTNG